MSQQHVPEDIEVTESGSTSFDSDSDNLSSDLDEELMKVCAAVASPPDGASIADLHKASAVLILSRCVAGSKLIIQALETAQKHLLNMRGRQQELLKWNVLLETSYWH
ncbi:uncharacterized protein HD556DRAFT_1441423 [Suillus plorans]|uniref:Uncharacterized protein n=1 Tax=Suillus plorans TaxID=116603 RepID=A0A9P7AXW0_9AGAM|nr:uncharacterized protein HD556DRAFT_1441423 [Suillus plorans]KAG1796731.1 hypothetical protein HD556DRAFT_1441423 [Suillus plorans]